MEQYTPTAVESERPCFMSVQTEIDVLISVGELCVEAAQLLEQFTSNQKACARDCGQYSILVYLGRFGRLQPIRMERLAGRIHLDPGMLNKAEARREKAATRPSRAGIASLRETEIYGKTHLVHADNVLERARGARLGPVFYNDDLVDFGRVGLQSMKA